MGLTGFVIIHVFIALLSPAQGERNQMVNTKFIRTVNEMPMANSVVRSVRFMMLSAPVIITAPTAIEELNEPAAAPTSVQNIPTQTMPLLLHSNERKLLDQIINF